jgi:hypothetical protein
MNGVLLGVQVINVVSKVTPHITAPIVLFTYYNIIMRRGAEQFCRDIKAAGATGVLLAMQVLLHCVRIAQSFLPSDTKQEVLFSVERQPMQQCRIVIALWRQSRERLGDPSLLQYWKVAILNKAHLPMPGCRSASAGHSCGGDRADSGGGHSGRAGAGVAHHSHHPPAAHGGHRQGFPGLCLPRVCHRWAAQRTPFATACCQAAAELGASKHPELNILC